MCVGDESSAAGALISEVNRACPGEEAPARCPGSLQEHAFWAPRRGMPARRPRTNYPRLITGNVTCGSKFGALESVRAAPQGKGTNESRFLCVPSRERRGKFFQDEHHWRGDAAPCTDARSIVLKTRFEPELIFSRRSPYVLILRCSHARSGEKEIINKDVLQLLRV